MLDILLDVIDNVRCNRMFTIDQFYAITIKKNIGFEKNIYNAKDNFGEKSYEDFYTYSVDSIYSRTINTVISYAKLNNLVEKPLSID